MNPQIQSIHNSFNGDCLRAVVASVMDLTLWDVPHFVELCLGCNGSCHEKNCCKWHDALAAFITRQGYEMIGWTKDQSILENGYEGYPFGQYYILIYDAGPAAHAVVASGNKICHDPNPSLKSSMIGVPVAKLKEPEILLVKDSKIQTPEG